ncbi:Glutamate synthase [NADPH] large chain [Candidatus Rhodobacter oscarellae]|uniref:Glutamate synthase [NADPH] large chain n=1 Tax=Candidatus Rhodobacter oscarellae TaxID=1675527 RepID=A0A0J9EB74_9RHOB|nr:Hint domain-containing protein [Candidatus Rhodobacter lobularis]KMW60022.1 Glutamate synthase [NADPH] large chain [Candidatus Rhodobacter lobularis]
MTTGFHGTFVISWTQTELDGRDAAPVSALAVGATWRWHGEATRVDGPGNILVLQQSEEVAELRRHAARSVQRLVQVAFDRSDYERLPDPDSPLLDRGFSVTDGVRNFTATLVEVPDRLPLLMFLGAVPPAGVDLWLTHLTEQMLHPNRSGDTAPSLICFTPDTKIATPDGQVRVRDLQEDDHVLTKDDGPQPIRWIGARRVSGARLFAMPELRPIRIRTGAVLPGVPDEDLLVSPEHRMLVQGEEARDLFGTDEVLVKARDLINDTTILRDHSVREVHYVHLLFDRHQILFANGQESESFHPASTDLEAMDPNHRAALENRLPGLSPDGSSFGAFARRSLSSAETAILLHS